MPTPAGENKIIITLNYYILYYINLSYDFNNNRLNEALKGEKKTSSIRVNDYKS